eukprot:TRINITY_DN2217_c0_g1_i12.p1 TRINITY_DN2217_c0_g1~~TRINITY_DN2217_c0_g1_i12.p1  ORF type:complete len:656 (-),score=115.52 TRINITY_DN2217_c0_g1_i12:1033-2790(-)
MAAELELVKWLSHPNIVECYETGETDEYFWIVMEKCEKYTLGSLLKQWQNGFASEMVQTWVAEIASAFQYLQNRREKIAHRDLKPDNILLGKDLHLKLADFGLAKEIEDLTETVCGNYLYSGPEVGRGKKYSTECDLWSLGLIIHQMICGRLPFDEINRENVDALKNCPYVCSFRNCSAYSLDLIKRTVSIEERLTWEMFFKHPFVCPYLELTIQQQQKSNVPFVCRDDRAPPQQRDDATEVFAAPFRDSLRSAHAVERPCYVRVLCFPRTLVGSPFPPCVVAEQPPAPVGLCCAECIEFYKRFVDAASEYLTLHNDLLLACELCLAHLRSLSMYIQKRISEMQKAKHKMQHELEDALQNWASVFVFNGSTLRDVVVLQNDVKGLLADVNSAPPTAAQVQEVKAGSAAPFLQQLPSTLYSPLECWRKEQRPEFTVQQQAEADIAACQKGADALHSPAEDKLLMARARVAACSACSVCREAHAATANLWRLLTTGLLLSRSQQLALTKVETAHRQLQKDVDIVLALPDCIAMQVPQACEEAYAARSELAEQQRQLQDTLGAARQTISALLELLPYRGNYTQAAPTK